VSLGASVERALAEPYTPALSGADRPHPLRGTMAKAPVKTSGKKAVAKKVPSKTTRAVGKKSARTVKKTAAKPSARGHKAVKPAARKGAAKKPAPRKGAAKKPAPRKGAAKNAPARKPAAAKKTTKKAVAKKAVAKKAVAKKTATKKTATKKTATRAKAVAKTEPPTKAVAKSLVVPLKKPQRKNTIICPLSGFEVKAEKPTLAETTLARLREKLEQERTRHLRQADELAAEAEQLATERDQGDTQFDEESGEGDTVNVERERDLLLSASARQTVEAIDRALDRMKAGTYGLCIPAGRRISLERLEAIPYAEECVDCKARAERRR
jgi:RNA polymerase-binding transcription factor DksA